LHRFQRKGIIELRAKVVLETKKLFYIQKCYHNLLTTWLKKNLKKSPCKFLKAKNLLYFCSRFGRKAIVKLEELKGLELKDIKEAIRKYWG